VRVGDLRVGLGAEVALPEPLDDPAVRGPLVAEVVNSVVVDVAVPPVFLNVAYGLAAPGADHQASAGLGLHKPRPGAGRTARA